MALEIEKKKTAPEENAGQKSAGLNRILWLLVIAIVIAVAVGNVYFADQYSTVIRVVGIAVLLVIALGIAAVTNQGRKALAFFGEAKVELRRIVWPTRPEAMQTTLIVMAVTVIASLILWAFDSVIVTVLNFLTELRLF